MTSCVLISLFIVRWWDPEHSWNWIDLESAVDSKLIWWLKQAKEKLGQCDTVWHYLGTVLMERVKETLDFLKRWNSLLFVIFIWLHWVQQFNAAFDSFFSRCCGSSENIIWKYRKDYNCTLKKQNFHEILSHHCMCFIYITFEDTRHNKGQCHWMLTVTPLSEKQNDSRRKCPMHHCESLYFRKTLLECQNIRGLCVQHQVSVAAWMGSGVSPEVGHCVPLVGFDWHFFWEGKVRVPFHPEKPSGTTSKLFQGLSAL